MEIKFHKEMKQEIERRQTEVTKEFYEQMTHELNANSQKGVWLFWDDVKQIHQEIDYHFEKLKKAEENIAHHFSEEVAKEKIKEHIADVANLLMMLGNAYRLYTKHEETK
jgi:DNA-binding transcriptional regulator GbsR (MarR family)